MAITTTNSPTLDSRYTNVSVSSGANQTQAQAIGNSIAKFYNIDLLKSPDLLQIWNTGNAAMVNGNPISNSDAFNAVYKAFDTTSA